MYKYYHNGKIVEAVESGNEPRLLYSVYEVIRILNGKPQLLAEHLHRLERSWNLSDRLKRKEYIGFDRLFEICTQVVEVNRLVNQNLRVDLDGANTVVKPVESFYPNRTDYLVGVDTVSMEYERPNPRAKISNVLLNEKVQQIRSIENIFEVLLVNEDNMVLEGSKSNVFFIKGNHLYTAPLDHVLSGVTREMVMKIAEKHGIYVHQRPVPISNVYMYDACFLTGTSIDLLPIRRIDSQVFRSASNPLFVKLLKEFREETR